MAKDLPAPTPSKDSNDIINGLAGAICVIELYLFLLV